MSLRHSSAQTSERGISLLEVLVATAIFAIMAMFALQITSNATVNVSNAEEARALRLLAERRLGEVAIFEGEHDDILEGNFSDFEDLDEKFKDWKWTLDIRDVVVFGTSRSDEEEYLFGDPADDEDEDEEADPNARQVPPEATQRLRELTLRVTASTDEGEGSYVETIVFLPLVETTAAGAAPASNQPPDDR